MTIVVRSGGYGVRVTDHSAPRNRRWVGTFETLEEARTAEHNASTVPIRRHTVSTTAPWGLEMKGEKTCRNCGARATALHHIVPRAVAKDGTDNVFANGLPLCGECHVGWHARRIAIPRNLLTQKETAFAIARAGLKWVDANYPNDPDAGLVDELSVLRDRVLELEAENQGLRRLMRRARYVLDDVPDD